MRSPAPDSISSLKAHRPRVLLIDPDGAGARALQQELESRHYRVWIAGSGKQARAMLHELLPNLVILDLILPDVDGLVLCADLKVETDLPIIVHSATQRKRDAILALRLGADDFVAKPVDVEDLEARIGAVLRRASGQYMADLPDEPDHYRVNDLVVDRQHRRATLGAEEIHLTPTEYRLLSALASRPDEVISRDELAQLAWGWGDANRSRTVDTHIRRLRVKLHSAKLPPPPIICARGAGYKISTKESDAHSDMTSVA